jgi:hypothetical protein
MSSLASDNSGAHYGKIRVVEKLTRPHASDQSNKAMVDLNK